MDQIEKIMRDLTRDFEVERQASDTKQIPAPSLAGILRVIGSTDRQTTDSPPNHHATPQDWSDLIDRVRDAAHRVREAEAETQEQEIRVRELLDRVREDMTAAHERIRAAESHAKDIQTRSDALLKAADARVREAEERARTAEAWLSKISMTIAEEFSSKDEKRLTA
ncbi:hypothetical protein ASF24_22560 [Methylobacterium sp. Leaf86]|uniref:hypothetical protein n=1 Tax=Methylobacterium sp. Leaf86 TaxID=1736242 RepID=UPI0006F74AAC|nr:hypothetical protein [Methylobacterium sp. Leaf86]KQO52660.1 hypothetical protein ASF24_22560 [Methylobacterium sp. Leaf86]